MSNGADRPQGWFRQEFLDKGLVTFAECAEHYAEFSSDDLMVEMRLLFSPPMLAIPFGVSATRYYALVDALVQCAANDRTMMDRERSKLVNICIDVCTYLRGRASDARRDVFNQALSTTLDKVTDGSVFPHVAALIQQGVRDFDGPYEASPTATLRRNVHPRVAPEIAIGLPTGARRLAPVSGRNHEAPSVSC